MKVNLNSYVTVKLTERGRDLVMSHAARQLVNELKDSRGWLVQQKREVFDAIVDKYQISSSGVIKVTLLEFIHIFGGEYWPGTCAVESEEFEVEQSDAG